MSERFAVIGSPIAHSLSPEIHQCFAKEAKIQLTYDKIQGDEQHFETQVRDFFTSGGKGLNITLPFKQRAFELAACRTARCEQAHAANTLWMKDNQLWADNTDGIGLLRDLTRFVEVTGSKILVLGAGGAVRGILGPLLDAKPKLLVVANRSLEKALALKTIFPAIKCQSLDKIEGSFNLIINATSASLDKETLKLPDNIFAEKPFCYDLAYDLNQATTFVKLAQSKYCKAADGLGMLIEQAAESFCIWNGFKPNALDFTL